MPKKTGVKADLSSSVGHASMSSPIISKPLTSGPLLARNTIWNLLGSVAPALVAIFCVPVILRGPGPSVSEY